MRWQCDGGFGREHLAWVDDDPGPVGAGQVRLEMLAWSLNYRDLLMVDGHYDSRLTFPWVPLSDGVGRVVEVGDGVTRVAVGDRVCPTFSPTWIDGPIDDDAVRKTRGGPIPGVATESIVLGEEELVHVPGPLTDAGAATLPCAAVTAFQALEGVEAGDTVLVLGSGGVSVWALQLAKARGARVVATTSTKAKADRLRNIGADHVVLYPSDDRWGRTIRKWTGGGVDRVIEVGGAGTLSQSLQAVRVGGTLSVIGVVAGTAEKLSVLPILMRQIRCQGVFVGSRTMFESLNAEVGAAGIVPVVERTFGFDALPEALASLQQGTHVGKVALLRVGA